MMIRLFFLFLISYSTFIFGSFTISAKSSPVFSSQNKLQKKQTIKENLKPRIHKTPKKVKSSSNRTSKPRRVSTTRKISTPRRTSSTRRISTPRRVSTTRRFLASKKTTVRNRLLKKSVLKSTTSSRQRTQPIKKGSQLTSKTAVPIKPTQTKVQIPSLDYFSYLNSQGQKNVKAGGMKKFFDQNQLGYGQTIAVIESCGTWGSIKNALTNSQSLLPKTLREDYKDRFLAPIGKGPGGDPNIKDADAIKVDSYDHGSLVASVLMDLSPQAKVLPVSTGVVNTVTKYSTEDALIELAARKDINVVNFSGGMGRFSAFYNPNFKGYNLDGTPKWEYTISFNPKVVQSLKTIIKSGKVIVMAAGNEGEQIQKPRELRNYQDFLTRDHYRYLFQHIFKGLTEEEKKSIIIAGNLDSDTRIATPCSNKPGSNKGYQSRFLFSPGKFEISYLGGVTSGTSLSAPYICAALANLLSKFKRITPKAAVKILLDSAELQKDVATYGRGIIRADRALDWLEEGK